MMNTEVLKEPRGFMRVLECFFAMVAFATCANYTVHNEFTLKCVNSTLTKSFKNDFYYPFRLDHTDIDPLTCIPNDADHTVKIHQPGDYKSDAEFFVFTGVVAFLGSGASIVLYVFFSRLYMDEQKKVPLYDFCFTVIIAVFWLSASAAWANGVSNLKITSDPNTFFKTSKICKEENFAEWRVMACDVDPDLQGRFGGANGSVMLGFLNFFLWASNLWFVYKETAWFTSRTQGQQMTNQP